MGSARPRRRCQLDSVPCGSVSSNQTLCPACLAASASPMASVLLPLPPFWVANTMVCMGKDILICLRAPRIRQTALHPLLDAEPFSLRTCRADPGHFLGSRWSESRNGSRVYHKPGAVYDILNEYRNVIKTLTSGRSKGRESEGSVHD